MASADEGKRLSSPSCSPLSTSSDFVHAAATESPAESTTGQRKRDEEDNAIGILEPGGISSNNVMRTSSATTLGEVDQLNDLRTDSATTLGEANASSSRGENFSHSLSDCSETTDFGLGTNATSMSQEGSTGHTKLVESQEGSDYADEDFLGASMLKNEQPSDGLEAPPSQPEVDDLASATTESPPTQVMERPGDPSSYRIPDYVFARNKSTAPLEWSTASNESLFSIQMGNMSFTKDQFPWLGKSGELGLPGEVSMPMPSGSNLSNIDFSSNQPPSKQSAAENSQKSGNLEEEVEPSPRVTEANSAATMREVIRENAENHEKANDSVAEGKYHSACLSHASDGSTRSFAFPILAGEGDVSCSLRGDAMKQRQHSPSKPKSKRESRPQTPKESPNGSSPQTPKPTPNGGKCRWGLSCFSCCPSCCS